MLFIIDAEAGINLENWEGNILLGNKIILEKSA